ncbi:MAG TPA: NPCBM/NEW2 domain-containing protein [Phycisphaerales bacterium]|nr:NPCBM/NEW2 domain-containing protein [Phycisphaerales bacterium]
MHTRNIGWSVLSVLVCAAPVLAADVPLSLFLGVPSGTVTQEDNPPFMDYVDGYALGVNCPGYWSSDPIQFGDVGVLEHGIGQHATESGDSTVTFDLDAIAGQMGPVTALTARVGIERFSQPGAGQNGATFRVFADGLQVAEVHVDNGFAASVPISVSLIGVHTLTLSTSRRGAFSGNHACWGLATLRGCPSDFDGTGFVDTDDFTAFVSAFEAGDDVADFDESGFVDTDDFTAFVLAFESGC